MIVAGGGLMGLTEWARRLAIRVAQLKILRWVAMIVTTMVMILPMTMESTQKAMRALEAQIKARAAACQPISLINDHALGDDRRRGRHDLRGHRCLRLSGTRCGGI